MLKQVQVGTVGKCPDLITGIHGDDPVQLYRELCEVVEEVIAHSKPLAAAAPPANAPDGGSGVATRPVRRIASDPSDRFPGSPRPLTEPQITYI